MSIKKIGINYWEIRVSARVPWESSPITKTERFSGTRSEAEGRSAELIALLKNKNDTTQLPIIFMDAANLYLDNLRAMGKLSAPHSRKIIAVCKEFGHLDLRAIPDSFEIYRRKLITTKGRGGKERSAASINRPTEIIRAVFGHLLKLEIIEKNPISKIRFPKLEETPRDRYLTQEEREKLFDVIKEHRSYIWPLIQYMSLVPCRISELITAKREQYNPFTGTIYIPDSKAGIPIHKPVPKEMKDYFSSIPAECPWLFYWNNEAGEYRPFITIQKPWRFCLKKAGVSDLRIHDLRHISATDLYEAGNAERTIMDVAGWKTPMLSTYRHKDSLRSAQRIVFKQ